MNEITYYLWLFAKGALLLGFLLLPWVLLWIIVMVFL